MFGKNDELTIVDTLNSTLTDSIKGYREAADHAEAQHIKQLFSEMADERASAAAELRAEVARLGGEADNKGSTAGYLHQRFLDLKAAVAGQDDKAIVNEVERGEDYLKEKFETALASDKLTGSSRETVERLFQSVREGHDRVSELKHAMSSS